MKVLYLNCLIIISLSLLLINCGGPKSQTLVIVQSKTKAFAIGEPPVIFKSYGAVLDYFSAGTIVVFKVDHQILKQNGLSGGVYQLNKELKLNKLGTFDTTLTNMQLAKEYLVDKNIMNDENELVEIDLK